MAPPAEAAGSPAQPAGALLKGALLLAGLLAAGYAARALGTGMLTRTTPSLAGAAALVAVGATLCAAGVPRQVVAFAGGYVFGVWAGGALALLAQMLGCLADFWWARAVARDWARQRIRGRLARLDTALAARPFTATLTLRLLPVGNNLALNLLAGVSGMAAWPFLAASLLGYLPQTAVFALAGGGVHVGRAAQLGMGVALFAASAALGAVLLARGGAGARGAVVREADVRRVEARGVAVQDAAAQGMAARVAVVWDPDVHGVEVPGVAAQDAAAEGMAERGVAAQDVTARGMAERGAVVRKSDVRRVEVRGVAVQDAAAQGMTARVAVVQDPDVHGVEVPGVAAQDAAAEGMAERGAVVRDKEERGVEARGVAAQDAVARGMAARGAAPAMPAPARRQS